MLACKWYASVEQQEQHVTRPGLCVKQAAALPSPFPALPCTAGGDQGHHGLNKLVMYNMCLFDFNSL